MSACDSLMMLADRKVARVGLPDRSRFYNAILLIPCRGSMKRNRGSCCREDVGGGKLTQWRERKVFGRKSTAERF